MELVAVVLSLVLALGVVLVGMAKVQTLPASVQVRDAADVSPRLWLLSGWAELVLAALLVLGIFAIHELAVFAAVLLAVDFAALGIRQLTRNAASAAPALVIAAVAVGAVAGILAAGV